MSKVDDIETVLHDGRYKTETKVDCVEEILDGAKFGEWVKVNELFDSMLYGGIKKRMTIQDAVEKIDSD